MVIGRHSRDDDVTIKLSLNPSAAYIAVIYSGHQWVPQLGPLPHSMSRHASLSDSRNIVEMLLGWNAGLIVMRPASRDRGTQTQRENHTSISFTSIYSFLLLPSIPFIPFFYFHLFLLFFPFTSIYSFYSFLLFPIPLLYFQPAEKTILSIPFTLNGI